MFCLDEPLLLDFEMAITATQDSKKLCIKFHGALQPETSFPVPFLNNVPQFRSSMSTRNLIQDCCHRHPCCSLCAQGSTCTNPASSFHGLGSKVASQKQNPFTPFLARWLSKASVLLQSANSWGLMMKHQPSESDSLCGSHCWGSRIGFKFSAMRQQDHCAGWLSCPRFQPSKTTPRLGGIQLRDWHQMPMLTILI